ncbi:hypothetical protein [Pseudoxanthomonas putridarboris]|uniref:Uncharacterized protein n=1 Tax=Pseudoxanthomonas putridarboris TaxID=752605 RepID=A0ABU9IV26_9GAMM
MRPHKTDLARRTLQAHDGTLGMRERRALILCDGQRDLDELVRLLGQDVPDLVQRLAEAGYLSVQASAHAPSFAAPAPATPARTQAGPRRSLVAAKVYALGMLELQRDDDAARHRQQLQSRRDDDALVEALVETLRFLESRVAASLAARIRERLAEVLPEEHLPRLGAATSQQSEPALS